VAYLDKGAPLLLRDAKGQHYDAPRRAYDKTTRLRRLAASAEERSGIIILIVPTRITGQLGPARVHMPGWEIMVSDGGGTGRDELVMRLRGYREAAAAVRGMSIGALAGCRHAGRPR
jgi:hypothetical protein